MKMLAQIDAPKIDVEKLIERIFKFRMITRIDQELLMSNMLAKDALSDREYRLVNRVFDALQQGRLNVVD
ncbi:MAG: hypothetical protein GDA43_23715 [Hormoscilla sp. SP5CHS1]|nr:hypothetical protein [Hormoscilla sp. SP12CHS1]MBC6455818.1 hypothetical protein [Hormoscilla sp. SP5CHS1]